MADRPSFDQYLQSLDRLTSHVDPTVDSDASDEIKDAAGSLAALDDVTNETLSSWVSDHPEWVYVLGLAVGLSREKLKNALRHQLGSSSWNRLAREQPVALVELLDREFDVVRLIASQRSRSYVFGDILVARAGTRGTATSAGVAGRKLEDEIELTVGELGLPYATRTRFTGRNGRTGPCDLVIPSGDRAEIVVAAKGFDSTGSKLTDAVREIEEMADVRLPRQFVLAVIDGIGWKSRQADLHRIYSLWESRQIDGLYSLSTLDRFRDVVAEAAQLRRLI